MAFFAVVIINERPTEPGRYSDLQSKERTEHSPKRVQRVACPSMQVRRDQAVQGWKIARASEE